MSEPKYAIGVDLGTTHSALSFIDLDLSEGEEVAQFVLPVPQLVAEGQVENHDLLPSFLYLPHAEEMKSEDLALPWARENDAVVGAFARQLGANTPIRLVSSAKSWLSHPGVDRRESFLPIEAPNEVRRVSPLEASTKYLEHLRDAWNHRNPDAPLGEQDVVLTVPASFDPAARELTAEAARNAGYARLTLLEEPQAALYSWIQRSEGAWRKDVELGDVILVIDIGGGTTDFSLMAVMEREGRLELHRIAVGDHILLGGDNMDLALAHIVRAKLEGEGKPIDAWHLRALTLACRSAKETLLAENAPDDVPIVIASRGSKLVGGSIRTELTKDEVMRTLVDGFFPRSAASDRPVVRARGALTQLGLPYAQDAAVTRHLAAFLAKQLTSLDSLDGFESSMPENATFLHPTAVLFNGGVLRAPVIERELLATLGAWLEADGGKPVRALGGIDLDLAVARGAAYYAYARHGRGIRIRGGTARSFYVGVETAMPAVPGLEPPVHALCVAPFGMEEGTRAELPPQEFGLVVGEPVRFRFFGSSVRRDDEVGTVLERWTQEELEEIESIEATLPPEGSTGTTVVPVRLRAAVTEVGTLLLEAVPRAGNTAWKVELNTRGTPT